MWEKMKTWSKSEACDKAVEVAIIWGCKYILLPICCLCMLYALVFCIDAGAKAAKNIQPKIPAKITVEFR